MNITFLQKKAHTTQKTKDQVFKEMKGNKVNLEFYIQ